MHSIQAANIGEFKPPAQLLQAANQKSANGPMSTDNAEAVRDAFTEFIGKTFFSQMLKAMRKSTDKPAYFHGGQGEEIFRSQLDQTLADEMSTASAHLFADPLFERQFPQHAAVLNHNAGNNGTTSASFDDLQLLRRR